MKTLTDQISAFQKEMASQVPEEVLAIMSSATQTLKESGIENRSLITGDSAPGFDLLNHKGENKSLSDYLSKGDLVLSFYRGGWCPYCNLELSALQASLAEITALGANLVAVSPEMPGHSMTTAEKNALEFDVLYDQGNKVAESFGLVMTLPNSLKPIYEQFGIDIPKHNGDETFTLPMPATYVINKEGTIVHHFVDVDYTKRLEPAVIIQSLKGN